MQRTLEDWEQTFRPYFAHIKLLSEIPLTRIECEEIGTLIRELVKKKGPTSGKVDTAGILTSKSFLNNLSASRSDNSLKGTRQLIQNYPKTFVIFLAMTAAQNTQRDYWAVIAETVSLSKQQLSNQGWGQSFLDILNAEGLSEFPELGSYKFVGPIRLHGGIPVYSLPDFFHYILLPSVNNHKYNQLPTPELLTTMLEKSSVTFFVDSPVTNFLQNGEDIAVDFVDRCRQMARANKIDKEIPSPEELDLPPYIVRTFRKYIEEELELETGKRFRAPWLQLIPWGPDFYLHLPSQQIEGVLASQKYVWRIELRNRNEEVFAHNEFVRIRRRGYDLETNEVELPVEIPAQRITISFCSQDQSNEDNEASIHILKRWQLNLMPTADQPPVLVFNPENARIIQWNQYLPSQELWVLYPEDIQIEVNGDKELIEEFSQLYTNWGNWCVEAYDFSRAFALYLRKNGKDVAAPIPFRAETDEPKLIGENRLTAAIDPDGIPLFIGAPPNLKIPLRSGRSIEQELNSWKIRIASRWAANPVFLNKSFDLAEYSISTTKEDNFIIFPLSAVMGERVVGTYDIHVSGPYYSQCEFRFRCWNELEIQNLERYYLPTKDGAPNADIGIKVPNECSVQAQAGVEGVRVQQVFEEFKVTVEPDISVADLYLVAQVAQGDPVRMPLSLAIPRLRWTVRTEQFDEELSWSSLPVKMSVSEFLQAEITSIHLDLPLPAKLPLKFNILLINPETDELLQEFSRPQEVNFRQTRWRFALGEFSDSLRQFDEQPIFEFRLKIENVQTGNTEQITVLRLSRELNISGAWIEFLDAPEFRLHWQEPKPLRNRRAQIWSIWQPWIPAIELIIPDDARGELLVTEVGLPPSQYHIHFLTALPWEKEAPPFDPPTDSHVVETAEPEKRISTISTQIASMQGSEFLCHFELACIYKSTTRVQPLKDEINWCFQNISKATPIQITAFHDWLSLHDPISQKAVRIQMYHPAQLTKLFESYPEKSSTRKKYLAGFLNTNLIKPESALLVLENEDDPALTMHSMLILLDQKVPEVIQHIYHKLEANELSDLDAINLFKKDPDFSIPAVSNFPDNGLKLRLVKQIVRVIPEQKIFVTKGYWVRTEAGWGKIEKIELWQEARYYYDRSIEKPKLSIMLRPDVHPEMITLDLNEESISFLSAKKVYVCVKDDCYKFASEDLSNITNNHNRASHGGLGPSFYPSEPEFSLEQTPEYSFGPPSDPFE